VHLIKGIIVEALPVFIGNEIWFLATNLSEILFQDGWGAFELVFEDIDFKVLVGDINIQLSVLVLDASSKWADIIDRSLSLHE
jgi:hypothetical protein